MRRGHQLSPDIHPPKPQGGPQSLPPRDLEDLKLAVDFGADWVGVPFVRSAADVQQVGGAEEGVPP